MIGMDFFLLTDSWVPKPIFGNYVFFFCVGYNKKPSATQSLNYCMPINQIYKYKS